MQIDDFQAICIQQKQTQSTQHKTRQDKKLRIVSCFLKVRNTCDAFYLPFVEKQKSKLPNPPRTLVKKSLPQNLVDSIIYFVLAPNVGSTKFFFPS
jgi:hypothetical protein